jgi:hypothetical protein
MPQTPSDISELRREFFRSLIRILLRPQSFQRLIASNPLGCSRKKIRSSRLLTYLGLERVEIGASKPTGPETQGLNTARPTLAPRFLSFHKVVFGAEANTYDADGLNLRLRRVTSAS